MKDSSLRLLGRIGLAAGVVATVALLSGVVTRAATPVVKIAKAATAAAALPISRRFLK